MNSSMELRAKDFAARCHGGIDQRRKYTGEPYINHPAAVVELVRSVPHTEASRSIVWSRIGGNREMNWIEKLIVGSIVAILIVVAIGAANHGDRFREVCDSVGGAPVWDGRQWQCIK